MQNKTNSSNVVNFSEFVKFQRLSSCSRQLANLRERNRMRMINEAFETLRQKLLQVTNDNKYEADSNSYYKQQNRKHITAKIGQEVETSERFEKHLTKVDILNLAVDYIKHLKSLLLTKTNKRLYFGIRKLHNSGSSERNKNVKVISFKYDGIGNNTSKQLDKPVEVKKTNDVETRTSIYDTNNNKQKIRAKTTNDKLLVFRNKNTDSSTISSNKQYQQQVGGDHDDTLSCYSVSFKMKTNMRSMKRTEVRKYGKLWYPQTIGHLEFVNNNINEGKKIDTNDKYQNQKNQR